jgi:hypothetical protein
VNKREIRENRVEAKLKHDTAVAPLAPLYRSSHMLGSMRLIDFVCLRVRTVGKVGGKYKSPPRPAWSVKRTWTSMTLGNLIARYIG